MLPTGRRSPRTAATIAGAWIVTALAGLHITAARAGDEQDDPERNLRKVLEDEHAAETDLWVYNDIERARAEARRLDRPLFVTFRCVPCKACAGFDAEVARGSERIDRLARDEFIAVRQVEMKGVDLSLFRFDFDLNWAAVFIHPDGTVYARYGTQGAEGPDAYNSIDGLEKTMRRVLRLHAGYPENADGLRGKRPAPGPYRTALEMPGLVNREKLAKKTSRENCIHCHNIHDAENRQWYRDGSAGSRDVLWRYPLPGNLGLEIDRDHGIRIAAVEPDSPAARAGLESGEELTYLGGQIMTSIADMQWVLHHLPNGETSVEARGSRSGVRSIHLERGWKETDISWRGSLWSVPPRLRVWAPELGEAQRAGLDLADGATAYLVRWINRSEPGGRAAHEAGLRQGDIILALEGKPLRWPPNRFMMQIKLEYAIGDRVPITVLRGEKRLDLRIPLVE